MLLFIMIPVSAVFMLAVFRYAAFFLSNHLAGELAEIREGTGPMGVPVLRGVVTAMLADMTALFNSLFLLLPEDAPVTPGTPGGHGARPVPQQDRLADHETEAETGRIHQSAHLSIQQLHP